MLDRPGNLDLGTQTRLTSHDAERLNTELQGPATTVVPGFVVTAKCAPFCSDCENYSDPQQTDLTVPLVAAFVVASRYGPKAQADVLASSWATSRRPPGPVALDTRQTAPGHLWCQLGHITDVLCTAESHLAMLRR
ncbi:hypothetical protein [Streptomyces goshikiensis]|uniref:hypothetical protein n=1 Tax=Streptomyces goshikiensis TaxID=1942 RepID=UPI002E1548B2|nr:hypothetical protein OG224_38075 [Streptomyces goshikiensis]